MQLNELAARQLDIAAMLRDAARRGDAAEVRRLFCEWKWLDRAMKEA